MKRPIWHFGKFWIFWFFYTWNLQNTIVLNLTNALVRLKPKKTTEYEKYWCWFITFGWILTILLICDLMDLFVKGKCVQCVDLYWRKLLTSFRAFQIAIWHRIAFVIASMLYRSAGTKREKFYTINDIKICVYSVNLSTIHIDVRGKRRVFFS